MNETCTRIRARLDDLVDGELDTAEAARVTEHLRGCAACLLDLLVRAEAIRAGIEPERDLWPDIRSRIDVGRPRRRPTTSPHGVRLWAWSATAAAVVLAIALAAVLALRPGSVDGDGGAIADAGGADPSANSTPAPTRSTRKSRGSWPTTSRSWIEPLARSGPHSTPTRVIRACVG